MSRFGLGWFALAAGIFALAATRVAGSAYAWQLPVAVEEVEVVGFPRGDAAQWGRDVGATAKVGSKVLWVFGDTLNDVEMRSSTAAWGRRRDDILSITEEAGEQKAPRRLVP